MTVPRSGRRTGPLTAGALLTAAAVLAVLQPPRLADPLREAVPGAAPPDLWCSSCCARWWRRWT